MIKTHRSAISDRARDKSGISCRCTLPPTNVVLGRIFQSHALAGHVCIPLASVVLWKERPLQHRCERHALPVAHAGNMRTSVEILVCGSTDLARASCSMPTATERNAHYAGLLKLRVWREWRRHTNPKRKRGHELRPISSSLAFRVRMPSPVEKHAVQTSKHATKDFGATPARDHVGEIWASSAGQWPIPGEGGSFSEKCS